MPSIRRLLPVLVLAAACAPAPEPPPPAPEPGPRLENPEMGLALATVPAPFEVTANEADRIVLTAPGAEGSGVLTITTGPIERFGINLIDAVLARKAAFEEAAGGTYFGNRELRAPIGTAFTARGAYDGETGRVEETWIYAVHPGQNRILALSYAYPPAESEARAPQALSVLGEVEALAAEEASGS